MPSEAMDAVDQWGQRCGQAMLSQPVHVEK